MKRILLSLFILLVLFVVASAGWYARKMRPAAATSSNRKTLSNLSEKFRHKLDDKGSKAASYAASHGYNTNICFLVDMSIESGKNRFFVYDMVKDSAISTGLVTHGRCNENWLNGRRYGNAVGCGCTSLGKYKVGNAYNGRFGLAYKLHGLDSSNSNAFKRYVVLHSHECVPAAEVHPYPICQSDGCPTVSGEYLKKLAATIDRSPRPILLWIYE